MSSSERGSPVNNRVARTLLSAVLPLVLILFFSSPVRLAPIGCIRSQLFAEKSIRASQTLLPQRFIRYTSVTLGLLPRRASLLLSVAVSAVCERRTPRRSDAQAPDIPLA